MNQFQSYRFFHGMKVNHLGLLIRCAEERIYQAGEVVFTEGSPVTHFFLIKSGALALYSEPDGETRVIKTAQSGDVLGWSCVLPRATWRVSGRTLGATSVTVVDGERLLDEARAVPEFGRELLKRAAQMEVETVEPTLLTIRVHSIERAGVQNEGATVSGNSPFLSNDALDISAGDAKQLSLHEGQWVQLTDRHGAAILPVHIKSPNG